MNWNFRIKQIIRWMLFAIFMTSLLLAIPFLFFIFLIGSIGIKAMTYVLQLILIGWLCIIIYILFDADNDLKKLELNNDVITEAIK